MDARKALPPLLIVWGTTIVWLSLVPSPPVPQSGLLGWDKFQHASAYGLLALLSGGVLTGSSLRSPWITAVCAATVFGGAMEIAQGLFTTSRTAEWGDLAADAVGAVVAAGTAALLLSRRKS